MPLNIKLIAIDLNEALLNKQSQISSPNIAAIKAAQKKGITIVFVTGKAYFDVHALLAKAGISAWVIAFNGAAIYDPAGTLLYAKPIEKRDVKELHGYFEEQALYHEGFSDRVIYAPRKGKDLLTIEMFKLKNRHPEKSLQKLMETAEKHCSQKTVDFTFNPGLLKKQSSFYKFRGFSFEKQKIEECIKRFELSREITILQPGRYVCEFIHADVSKGSALKYVSWQLNLSPKQILVFSGDDTDLSMVHYAGLSIAMETAKKKCKSSAAVTAFAANQNEVAQIIQSLI